MICYEMDLIIFADYFNENLDCISYPFENCRYLFFSIDDILNNLDEIRFFGFKNEKVIFTGYFKNSVNTFYLYVYEIFNPKDFSELINIQTRYNRLFNIIKRLTNLFFQHLSIFITKEIHRDLLIDVYISIKYNKYKIFDSNKL
jgi:hypothetical protein